jgi:hypothetical protein
VNQGIKRGRGVATLALKASFSYLWRLAALRGCPTSIMRKSG